MNQVTPLYNLDKTSFFALYGTRDKQSRVQIHQFGQLGSETGSKLCHFSEWICISWMIYNSLMICMSIHKNYTISSLFLIPIAKTDVFVHKIACLVCHRVQIYLPLYFCTTTSVQMPTWARYHGKLVQRLSAVPLVICFVQNFKTHC